MSNEVAKSNLTFAEACEYLSISPDDMVRLRDARLVAVLRQGGRQTYPTEALDITNRLLHLTEAHGWSTDTLAWYGDLCFFNSFGQTQVRPIDETLEPTWAQPLSWLERQDLRKHARGFEQALKGSDEAFNDHLRSIVFLAMGEGNFWPDLGSVEQSALYPIIAHLQQQGVPIVGQDSSISRDAHYYYLALITVFGKIASPMSLELENLIATSRTQSTAISPTGIEIDAAERKLILAEPRIAVDKFYALNREEIHSLPTNWEVKVGVLVGEKKTLAFQWILTPDTTEDLIDNIIDAISP